MFAVALFGTFTLGARLGTALAVLELPASASAAGIAVCLLFYWLLLLVLPFWPFYLSEFLLSLAGACLIAWPMSSLPRLNRDKGSISTKPRGLIVLFASWLPLAGIMFSTLIDRVNYAERLGWSCDGPVLERTRNKGNHNLPMLVVAGSQGEEHFTMVDGALWQAAKPGKRLVKRAGSAFATLDGVRYRMVPPGLGWRRDPDAPASR